MAHCAVFGQQAVPFHLLSFFNQNTWVFKKKTFFKFISLVKIHLIRKLLFSIIIHNFEAYFIFYLQDTLFFQNLKQSIRWFYNIFDKIWKNHNFNIEKNVIVKNAYFLKKIKIWSQIFQNAIPTRRTLERVDVPRMVARSRSPTCGVWYAYFSFIDFLLLFLSGIYFEYMREWTWLIEFF